MLALLKLNCYLTAECLVVNLTFLITILLIVLLTIFIIEKTLKNEKPN